ncbi:extracellular solute-binding protein [Leucobacter sp. gxy201]|uniref:ABC transporter substrate-binding protein n=1 Tax=Leucobacter sp. gxy201 TaxID=2957200 RepID=UPI003DA13307
MSQKSRRVMTAALPLSLAAALALTGCGASGSSVEGSPDSGDLNVQVYGDWPFVQAAADSFMKEHPDAKIKVGGITNEQMRESGGRLFTSSDAPDVVSYTLQDAYMEDWIAAGALQPLDDVWKENDLESVVSGTTVDLATASDGKKYSVPVALTLLPYVYMDTEQWASFGGAAPDPETHTFASVDEFSDSLQAAKDAGLTPLSVPGNPFVEYLFGSLLQTSCGTDLYTEISTNWQKGGEKSAEYTDPCVVNALEQLGEWGEKGYFAQGVDSLTFEQSQTLFDTQKSPTWIMGSWVPPVYEPEGFTWDWALFPSLGDEPTAHGVSLDSFLVPQGAKNPELAKSFISYLTSKAVVEDGMNKVPAREDVDLSKVIESPILTSIVEQYQTAPQAPGWFTMLPASVEQEFSESVVSGVMSGRVSAKDAAAALQDAASTYREQHS